MFYNSPYFYYITVGLQAVCVIHCIRKGNQSSWIWLIIFLPLLGSLIYMITEMFSRRDIKNVSSGVGAVFNPSGKIKKLEEALRFADTFKNKEALADAYFAAGQTERAIDLYESCLSTTFAIHEHVQMQLIYAYAKIKNYAKIVSLGKQIYTLPQFTRSRANMLYAMALSHMGNITEAEKEFQLLQGRFSNYESRYQYACFLIRIDKKADAKKVLQEMLAEVSHLNSKEKRANREWLDIAKEELKKNQ